MSDDPVRSLKLREAQRLMNMTVSDLRRWQKSSAYRQYAAKRRKDGADPDMVVRRTIRVRNGDATTEEAEKVISFISRMKKNSAGRRKYGVGRGKVSARTASLRSWGFDPTGRYS